MATWQVSNGNGCVLATDLQHSEARAVAQRLANEQSLVLYLAPIADEDDDCAGCAAPYGHSRCHCAVRVTPEPRVVSLAHWQLEMPQKPGRYWTRTKDDEAAGLRSVCYGPEWIGMFCPESVKR